MPTLLLVMAGVHLLAIEASWWSRWANVGARGGKGPLPCSRDPSAVFPPHHLSLLGLL